MRHSVPGLMKVVVLCSPAVLGGWGCAGAPKAPREGVSGTVSRDGKPLEQGSIQFLNDEASGGAVIAQGRFRIAAEPGLSPGNYRVIIEGGEAPAAPAGPADGPPGVQVGPSHKKSAPKRPDRKPALTAKVKAGGPNVFEFALTD